MFTVRASASIDKLSDAFYKIRALQPNLRTVELKLFGQINVKRDSDKQSSNEVRL